jgi:hypothetical protein
MYAESYRAGWIVCGAFEPYRRIHRFSAVLALVAQCYREAVRGAIENGEPVPQLVRDTFLSDTETWIMESKAAEAQQAHFAAVKRLTAQAAEASAAGTPTWVDRDKMKLTTVPPNKRPRSAAVFAPWARREATAKKAPAKRKAAAKKKAPAKKKKKTTASKPKFKKPTRSSA